MPPVRELPPHYQEALHYVLTEGRRLLWLNVASLIPIVLSLMGMAGWWVLVSRLRGDVPEVSGSIPWWLGLIAIFVIVLPLHELFHGLAIQSMGHRARYGMKLNVGVLYATADGALFRRNEYTVVAFAPLVGITLVGMALMLILPGELAYYVAIGVVLNAGGAIADVWSALLIQRFPPSALIRDEEDGFRVFVPA